MTLATATDMNDRRAHPSVLRSAQLDVQTQRADVAALKACWSNVAAPVAIVTLRDSEGKVHGTTITAFSSISFDPAIVMISLAHGANFLKHLNDHGDAAAIFALNIMAPTHAVLAATCASKAVDKFDKEQFVEGHHVPFIVGASASFACSVNNMLDAGDHRLVFANIAHALSGPPQPG